MKQTFIVLGIWTALLSVAAAAQPENAAATRTTLAATGKERLGDKASDDQRVNDCHVPPEKRGSSRRPTECAQK
jgi:hypothetical protein